MAKASNSRRHPNLSFSSNQYLDRLGLTCVDRPIQNIVGVRSSGVFSTGPAAKLNKLATSLSWGAADRRIRRADHPKDRLIPTIILWHGPPEDSSWMMVDTDFVVVFLLWLWFHVIKSK